MNVLTRTCVRCKQSRTVQQGWPWRYLPYACPPCLPKLDQPDAPEWVRSALEQREGER